MKFQGKDNEKGTFICKGCNKDFYQKSNLTIHIKTFVYYRRENLLKKIEILENEKEVLKQKVESLEKDKEKWINHSEILAKNHTYKENIIIEIDDEDDISDENKDNDEYKLLPLELGQGYTIEHRDEDGFINVTNLCKAGNKKFTDWFRLDKTKAFLEVLSESTGILTNTLIKYNTGSNKERKSYMGSSTGCY